MKYIYLSSLMIALSAFFLIGCENAEYKAQSNSLYITDAAGTNNVTTVTMDDGADINVVVRLAQKVMEDVEVEILTSYNEETPMAKEHPSIGVFLLSEGAFMFESFNRPSLNKT